MGARLPGPCEIWLAVSGDHGDARPPVRAVRHLAHEHVTRNVGQTEVREDDVELVPREAVRRFASGSDRRDASAIGPQEHHEDFTNVGNVLDHEDTQVGQAAGLLGYRDASLVGSEARVVPGCRNHQRDAVPFVEIAGCIYCLARPPTFPRMCASSERSCCVLSRVVTTFLFNPRYYACGARSPEGPA